MLVSDLAYDLVPSARLLLDQAWDPILLLNELGIYSKFTTSFTPALQVSAHSVDTLAVMPFHL